MQLPLNANHAPCQRRWRRLHPALTRPSNSRGNAAPWVLLVLVVGTFAVVGLWTLQLWRMQLLARDQATVEANQAITRLTAQVATLEAQAGSMQAIESDQVQQRAAPEAEREALVRVHESVRRTLVEAIDRGSLGVQQTPERLRFSLDAKELFVNNDVTLTAEGKTLLCSLADSLRLAAKAPVQVLMQGYDRPPMKRGKVAPLPPLPYSLWRAGNVVEHLRDVCHLDGMRLALHALLPPKGDGDGDGDAHARVAQPANAAHSNAKAPAAMQLHIQITAAGF